jgi:hypothetical protein
MERENSLGKKETSTMEIISKTKCMAKVNSFGQVVKLMKELGKMVI